jgi:hypothetical protein
VFCRLLLVFSGVCVAPSLVFCVVFCRLLFVFNWVCTQKTKDGATQTQFKTNNNLQNTTQKTKDGATQTQLKTNNNLQNTTQKTKDGATQTPLKTNNNLLVDYCLFLIGFVLHHL